MRLRKGSNRLTLRYTGPDIHPGSAAQVGFGLGPLIVGRSDPAELKVTYVPASKARTLCGKSLDWIEAVGRPVVTQNDAGEAPGLPGVERARAAP